MIKGKYEIKGLRVFPGVDGQGFTASLYYDGKRVASATEYGHGAEMLLCWKSTEDQTRFAEYCASLGTITVENTALPSTPDLVIQELANQHAYDKAARAACKKAIYFKTPDDIGPEWRVIRGIYTPEVDKALVKEYGPGVQILNRTYGLSYPSTDLGRG